MLFFTLCVIFPLSMLPKMRKVGAVLLCVWRCGDTGGAVKA